MKKMLKKKRLLIECVNERKTCKNNIKSCQVFFLVRYEEKRNYLNER